MSTTADDRQQRGRVRVERGAKRVRAFLGGHVVVDTARSVLVWEVPYYPTYYFPDADVRAKLEPTEQAGVFDLVTARRTIPAVVRQFDESSPELQLVARKSTRGLDGTDSPVAARHASKTQWALNHFNCSIGAGA